MKKIIIAANSMDIGGTEKALIGMLKSIDYNKYNVTLLLKEKKGDLLNEVPTNVNVKNYPGYNYSKKRLLKEKKIVEFLKYVYYAILMRLTKDTCKKYIYSTRITPKIYEEYDLAIAYYMPISTQVVYVLNNICANKKYAWLHCDITKMGNEMKQFENIYNKYDKVFCVSNETKIKSIAYFPSLKEKANVFYNILDGENIIKKSNEYYPFKDEFDGIRVCTIGRLSPEKQQDLIIPLMEKLKKNGYKVKWYCIGDGILREKLEVMIKENHLENDIILTGSKKNPYPYIKECDIYVQLSRHEGYCLSLAEARYLGKPIVTTNFSGAKEQIKNNFNGIVVENNKDEIFLGIKKLLDNTEIREKFSLRLQEEQIYHNNEIEKLYKELK